jgi:transposase-like protein
MVLLLYAKGLTTGEISAHFAEIYGASVSKETISRITDKVLEEMADWCNRTGKAFARGARRHRHNRALQKPCQP